MTPLNSKKIIQHFLKNPYFSIPIKMELFFTQTNGQKSPKTIKKKKFFFVTKITNNFDFRKNLELFTRNHPPPRIQLF